MDADTLKAAREAIAACGGAANCEAWLVNQSRDEHLVALGLAGIEAATAAEADHVGDANEMVESLRAQKDAAYTERDRLVCALSKVFPSHLSRHPDSDESWDDDWRWIVFVNLPTGQASWHIHDSERPWFEHLAVVEGNPWDGHTTEEKYQRVDALKPAEAAPSDAEIEAWRDRIDRWMHEENYQTPTHDEWGAFLAEAVALMRRLAAERDAANVAVGAIDDALGGCGWTTYDDVVSRARGVQPQAEQHRRLQQQATDGYKADADRAVEALRAAEKADVPDDVFVAIEELAEAAYEWAESDTEPDSPQAARERAKDSELRRLVAKIVAQRDRAVEALLNNKLASAVHACRECDGTGAVTCTGPTGEFSDQWQEPCPECSVDEKDELQIERERHAEVIDDLQRKIRVVAKERERAEQAETERDAARKALRGLVEAGEVALSYAKGNNYTAQNIRGHLKPAVRTAKEVLDGR